MRINRTIISSVSTDVVSCHNPFVLVIWVVWALLNIQHNSLIDIASDPRSRS
jgi:hypothetical protein